MNSRIKFICNSLRDVMEGQPWYGRSMLSILKEVDPSKVYQKPVKQSHSLIELLYHVINWYKFTLDKIKNGTDTDDALYFEQRDWITIDIQVHTWEKGLNELREVHEALLALLADRDNAFLEQIVESHYGTNHGQYHYSFLLNGLIQHNVYHLGQIAYLHRLMN